MRNNVKQLTNLAILISLSVVLIAIIRFPIIPMAPFLEYEPGDVPMILAGLIYGSTAGLLVTAIAVTIQAFTVSAGSGWIGLVMHFIATGVLVLCSSTICKKNRSFRGLVMGLAVGSVAMVACMIPLNLIFTVIFLGAPYDVVKAMIVPVLIPFNVIKAVANSVLAFIVFKGVGKLTYKKEEKLRRLG